MKKVLLGVKDRIMLLGILPVEENFLTLKVVRELKSKVGFTDEEHTKLSLKFHETKDDFGKPRTSFTWDLKADTPREFEFGDKESEIIRDALTALDKAKKLSEGHFVLCETFMA